jgi:hypothetical protein
MKTLEREMGSAFGTKENNLSFPPEHCASFTISHESKTLVWSLVSASFAKVRGEHTIKHTDGCITIRKEPGDYYCTLWFDSLFCAKCFSPAAFSCISISCVPNTLSHHTCVFFLSSALLGCLHHFPLFFSLSSILYFFVPNKPLVIRTCVV